MVAGTFLITKNKLEELAMKFSSEDETAKQLLEFFSVGKLQYLATCVQNIPF